MEALTLNRARLTRPSEIEYGRAILHYLTSDHSEGPLAVLGRFARELGVDRFTASAALDGRLWPDLWAMLGDQPRQLITLSRRHKAPPWLIYALLTIIDGEARKRPIAATARHLRLNDIRWPTGQSVEAGVREVRAGRMYGELHRRIKGTLRGGAINRMVRNGIHQELRDG